MKGIARSLIGLAFEGGSTEGPHDAIVKADRWRFALEEMAEVANVDQLPQIVNLLWAVNAAISNICLNTTNIAMGLPKEESDDQDAVHYRDTTQTVGYPRG